MEFIAKKHNTDNTYVLELTEMELKLILIAIEKLNDDAYDSNEFELDVLKDQLTSLIYG